MDDNAASTSDSAEFQPKLARKAQRDNSSPTPMAASTCEGFTLPEEQAAPELSITPSRSSAIKAVSADTPGSVARGATPAFGWGRAKLPGTSGGR